MSKKNIFEKSDFIVSNNYKDWNNALFITVLLDEEKKKEMENDNFEN